MTPKERIAYCEAQYGIVELQHRAISTTLHSMKTVEAEAIKSGDHKTAKSARMIATALEALQIAASQLGLGLENSCVAAEKAIDKTKRFSLVL